MRSRRSHCESARPKRAGSNDTVSRSLPSRHTYSAITEAHVIRNPEIQRVAAPVRENVNPVIVVAHTIEVIQRCFALLNMTAPLFSDSDRSLSGCSSALL